VNFALRVEKQSTFVSICDHFLTSSSSAVAHLSSSAVAHLSSLAVARLSSLVEDRRLSSSVEDRRLSSSVGARPSFSAEDRRPSLVAVHLFQIHPSMAAPRNTSVHPANP
jgi:hypothetical protein